MSRANRLWCAKFDVFAGDDRQLSGAVPTKEARTPKIRARVLDTIITGPFENTTTDGLLKSPSFGPSVADRGESPLPSQPTLRASDDQLEINR